MQSRQSSVSTISVLEEDSVLTSSNSFDLSSRSELLGDSDHRKSLGVALENSRDFYFDMSDRWKYAFLTTMDDPIRPEPVAAPPLRGLKRMESFFIKRNSMN
jgi:hypothetical protein